MLAVAGQRAEPGEVLAALPADVATQRIAPELADAGLLNRVAEERRGAPAGRGLVYQLNPLVRAFADELLAGSDVSTTAPSRDRHQILPDGSREPSAGIGSIPGSIRRSGGAAGGGAVSWR